MNRVYGNVCSISIIWFHMRRLKHWWLIDDWLWPGWIKSLMYFETVVAVTVSINIFWEENDSGHEKYFKLRPTVWYSIKNKNGQFSKSKQRFTFDLRFMSFLVNEVAINHFGPRNNLALVVKSLFNLDPRIQITLHSPTPD